VIEAGELLRVVTVIQAVSGVWWRGCGGVVRDPEVGSPPIVDDADSPEAMLGVVPSTEDDVPVECDFATGGIEEDLASGIA
jgi:hypothetical protein